MIITVDSNVLLSVFAKDSLYDKASFLLEKYSANEYVINDSIYLELAVHFTDFKLLDEALNSLEVNLVKEEKKDFNEILKGWTGYLKNKKFHCPHCGKTVNPICPKCQSKLKFRQRILTDFLIGGFAQANSSGILSLDTKYYKSYFPELFIFK
jgi:hypothetical protein